MPALAACPSTEQLRRFSAGELTDQDARSLESHLLSCHVCVQALASQEGESVSARVAISPALAPGEAELLESVANGALVALADTAVVRWSEWTNADAATATSLPAPPLPERIEYFRPISVLGQGGMGTVYLAEDTRLGRNVALKTLRPEFAASEKAKDRFLREARAAARLEHDHVVAIYYVGEADGIPFLAMPLLQGESLDALLSRTAGPLAPSIVVRIAREAALGLAAAHERGLIHRDIKPANLWLEAPSGRVKILDFGLAKAAGRESAREAGPPLTAYGVTVGTPEYMSPEQASGKEVDARADLFSLGCVLYEMLTVERPFTGPSAISVLTSLAVHTPPAPHTLNTSCPAALSQLVMRLLEKDPAQRIASAQEVIKALAEVATSTVEESPEEAAIVSDPVTVQPISIATRPEAAVPVRRAARRGRRIAVLAAVGLLALLFIGILYGGQIVRIVTNQGVLVVEVNDPSVEIKIVHNGVEVQDKPNKRTFTLAAGKGEIEVLEKDGVKLKTKKFGLTRGGKATVTVTSEELADARKPRNLGAIVVKGPPLPAQPQVAVRSDKEKPFLLIRRDGNREEFKHAAETLAVLQAGDAIEVHGNGPFTVPAIKLDKGLSLKAAPGYRPVLRLNGPLEVNGLLLLVGCDLHGTDWALIGGGERWEVRGCRLFMFRSHGNDFLMRYSGPQLVLSECLTHHPGGGGLAMVEGAVEIVMTDCIDLTPSPHCLAILGGQSGRPGGMTVRLRGNTLQAGVHYGVVSANEKNKEPITVEAEGNLFLTRPIRVSDGSPAALPRFFLWQGRDNLYVGDNSPGEVVLDGKQVKSSLANWNKLWGREEEGSQEVKEVFFAWQATAKLPPDEALAYVRRSVDAEKEKHGAKFADLGPDWSLIGPGDAYVRALEKKSGKTFSKEQLRPSAPQGGPFVILRDGALVQGFVTLAKAATAAKSGDTIEVRTDGPFAGGDFSPREKQLAIRAAPGYRPTVEGGMMLHDELTVEGLHFRDGGLVYAPKKGRLAGCSNCSFAGQSRVSCAFAEDGKTEFVNCLIPGTLGVLRSTQPKCRLAIRNSVVGSFSNNPTEEVGEAQIEIERSVFWCSGNQRGLFASQPTKCELSFVVRNTMFDTFATSVLFHVMPVAKWDGRLNVYRHSQPGTLDALEKLGSQEEGSLETEPLIYDPPAWRPLPGTPQLAGGQDYGADVDKVARAPATEAINLAATDPDRRAAEWVLSVGGTVTIKLNGAEREIHAASDLPRGAFELTSVHLQQNPKVSDEGLAHFKDCGNLTHLYLWSTQVGDAGLVHFKDCPNLVELDLSNTQVSDVGLAHFQNRNKLSVLNLENTKVSDEGLVHFKDCKDLTGLNLRVTQVSDAGLAHFKDCKHLSKLQLGFTRVSDAGLAVFKDCGNLTYLDLGDSAVSDVGLAHFQACKKLTHLQLTSTQLTDAGLAYFQDCKHLVHLNLSNTRLSDAGLAHLKDCKNLVVLHLDGTPVSDAGLAHFQDCPNLAHLSLQNILRVTDSGLAHFQHCKDLVYLNLRGTQVSDAGLALFKNRQKLAHVNLYSTQVSDAALADLAGLPNAQSVELLRTRVSLRAYEQFKAVRPPNSFLPWSESNRIVAEAVLALGGTVEIGTPGQPESRPVKTAADLPSEFFQVRRISLKGVDRPLEKLPEHLADLRFRDFDRLESLDLSGIAGFNYDCLVPIHGLRELNLSGAGLNDVTLAALPKLPALARLVLDGNELRGAGLASLASFPELVDLSLVCPELADLFAKNLAELKQLKRLSLAGSGVGDAGIKHLSGLSKLESLDLRRTKVSAAGVAELEKDLPKCRIVWDGTEGT